MPVHLYSRATDRDLVVDPSTSSVRSTAYETGGDQEQPLYGKDQLPNNLVYSGSYFAACFALPTVLTAFTVYWTIRPIGPRVMHVRRINLKTGFSGTAALTNSFFAIARGGFGLEYSGGSIQLPVVKETDTFPSMAECRFASGGLTYVNGAAEMPTALIGTANQVNNDESQDFDFAEGPDSSKLLVYPGQAIIIYAATAIVSGAYFVGNMEWDELKERSGE